MCSSAEGFVFLGIIRDDHYDDCKISELKALTTHVGLSATFHEILNKKLSLPKVSYSHFFPLT